METESLEHFKDWSNYLLVTTVAALGWVATKDLGLRPTYLRTLCILFFGLSVVFAIFTLALLPLIAEQIQGLPPSTSMYRVAVKSDLLEQLGMESIFLRNVCFPQHAYFLIGIVLYAFGASYGGPPAATSEVTSGR
jgi:hypothetical protein